MDTNVLVSECLRQRGRLYLPLPAIKLFASERVDSEFRHELARRLAIMVERQRVSEQTAETLHAEALELYERYVSIVGADKYADLEAHARTRVPDDADDWPSVALALAIDAGLWTEDRDFFGCGLPVWRTDVLYQHLTPSLP